MAARTVKVEGLRELDRALGELPKATARAALQRTLKKAAQPVKAAMKAKAPKLTHDLEESIVDGTKLTRRQARMVKKDGKDFATRHVGSSNPAAIPQEFGTFKESAQPFARPAWAATQDEALDIIKRELGGEIMKSARRLAIKQTRGR